MKTPLLGLFFLLFTDSLQGQVLIGRSAKELHAKITEYKPVLVSTSDTLIRYNLNPSDSEYQGVISSTYYLTKEGKIHTQKFSSDCRQCLQHFLNHILAKRKYKWKKINGNQYVSRFSKRLLLETDPDLKPEFLIMKTTWTRRSYKLLLE